MLILRFALLCSLPGLLLPSPAAAQRWNDLEDALEGRELVLRPTFEGRRKVYLDAEDDRVFVLHRGDRLFPLRESETVRITDADPEDDHIELELQSARLGRGRVDVYGPARSGRPGSLLTLVYPTPVRRRTTRCAPGSGGRGGGPLPESRTAWRRITGRTRCVSSARMIAAVGVGACATTVSEGRRVTGGVDGRCDPYIGRRRVCKGVVAGCGGEGLRSSPRWPAARDCLGRLRDQLASRRADRRFSCRDRAGLEAQPRLRLHVAW